MARSLSARGMAALRGLLKLRPPASEQEEAVLRDQASLLYYLSLLFSTTGTVNVLFIVLHFRPLDRPVLPLLGAALLLIYASILYAGHRWRRQKKAFPYLRRACALYVGLGFSWGLLINCLAYYSEPDQHALVIGLALGVVSTPIICVPAIVAFSFFLPDAFLSLGAVLFLDMADAVTTIAFACFILYAVVGILCTNSAFNGRSEARAALQRENATVNVFLREYQERSPDWLWETDPTGRLLAMPANLAAVLDLPAEDRPWRLDEILHSVPAAATDGQGRPSTLVGLLRHGLAFRDIIVTGQRGPQRRWFMLTGHPVHDENGTMVGFRGIGRDITERHEADQKLAYMARHDGLTGLLNRKAFVGLVEQACQDGRRFALVSIDLDDFKGKNDSYGHQIGDALLVRVAERIRSMIRQEDAAGRLGGDEFAVLFHDLDAEAGHAAATRLAALLAEPVVMNDVVIMPGASLGVAASDETRPDAPRMFLLTDLALYKAKESGKGVACRFEPVLEAEYRARLLQETELAEAIAKDQITAAYQPIADLMTGQVLCAEALARWRHPVRGPISPEVFIQVAEKSDLIEQLGETILRRACQDAAGWPEPLQVNVNLSPRQLASGRLPGVLAKILEETGLPPGRLAIEITETLLMDFSEEARRQLRTIRAQGVKLVLDDFGTGYSSLSYLRAIDVDGIKIDASFLRQLPDRKVEAIIRTITRLAADLNIYLVAEGVEHPSQLEWLRQNGIHFGQGYLLGRPREEAPIHRAEYLV